jgi:hypothetical protein
LENFKELSTEKNTKKARCKNNAFKKSSHFPVAIFNQVLNLENTETYQKHSFEEWLVHMI